MRIWFITLASIAVGTATGLGITWFEFHNSNEYFEPVSLTKPAIVPEKDSPKDKKKGPVAVVVGGTKFDFGSLNHDQSREKTFVIRNDGSEKLNVSWAGESCGKCITNAHDFQSRSLEPGESCEVIVTYATKKMDSQFQESAYIATNDPRNPSLQLTITGYVTLALKLEPDTLVLSSISNSEPTEVTTKLYGFHSDRLELKKHEFSNPATGERIELAATPMTESAVREEEHARAGLDLRFVFKPGLPIGPLSQNVTLTAMGEKEETIVLPINGTVVGDLSVYGRHYDAQRGNLNIGVVNRDTGLTVELFVLAKGPTRNDIRISVGAVEPEGVMQIDIGQGTPLADGKAVKIPVRVTIPKGTSVMSRLGNSQGKAGTLTLNTTHPISKELSMNVRFAVE